MKWFRALSSVAVASLAVPPGFPGRKPTLIRVTGWLALVGWLVAAGCFYIFAVDGSQPPMAVATVFFGFVGFVLLIIWAASSVFLWAMKYKANAMLSMVGPFTKVATDVVMQRMKEPAGPAVKDFAGMWLPTCDRCRQPALFHCRRDQLSLCWACLQAHDSDQCLYVRAARVVPPELQGRGR